MGMMSFVGWLFGADAAAPSDAMKLGTTEATLVRSLSALPLDQRGWITFAEARILFLTEGAQYAFGLLTTRLFLHESPSLIDLAV
jgi:hypothetical protein